jgi:signal transduction histidine kinase
VIFCHAAASPCPGTPVRLSTTRLLTAGFGLALVLAASGALWEFARFGASPEASAARLERHVRSEFTARAAELAGLTERTSALAPEFEDVLNRRDALPPLFLKLLELTRPTRGSASITVYAPEPDFRALAWSDGPAEDLPAESLRTGDGLFVAPGTLGLRMVNTRVMRSNGRLVGIATAETILSPTLGGTAPDSPLMFDTPFGDVVLVEAFAASSGNPARPHAFVVTGADGRMLVEVRYDPATIAAARTSFRRAALAVAAMPLVLALLLVAGPWLERRHSIRTRPAFLLWSIGIIALLGAAAAALVELAHLAGFSAFVTAPIAGLFALAVAATGPVSIWLRPPQRLSVERAPAQFLAEQLAAGSVAAIVILSLFWFLRWRLNTGSADPWQFALFPLRPGVILEFSGVLLVLAAGFWSAATLLASIAERWRVRARVDRTALAAIASWSVAALVGAALWRARVDALPAGAVALVAVTVVVFALIGARLRRHFRRTTQAARLGLLFGALVLPALVFYPGAATYAGQAARRVVETDYARAIQRAEQPRHLQEELGAAQAEIDRFPGLAEIVNERPQSPTQAAFTVWSQTRLSQNRVTSAIELYDANGALVSRFALNVPEYGAAGLGERVTNCSWTQSGEAGRFGAEERRMLRGERAICDEKTRAPRGSIVVHLMPDYRALPFVASNDPYFDVLRPDALARGSRFRGPITATAPHDHNALQVAVYGWGLLPRFASGNVAWPITPDLFKRLYRSREPFWTELTTDDRAYHVHFSNDRGGIYAVGYPVTSPFEHLTRLAEATTLLSVVFLLLLFGATIFAPFARRRDAALRVFVHEVRTSFYRKLFLYFVLAAVGPVVALSLVFGTYMADRFRADIENEATADMAVARRVFEELLTLQESAPTDDLLVWIGQAINQDVNLFSGSQLVATSQRDLFDSGLLPTRTPAAVYRSIALDRLPSYVGDDRLGGFPYLIAATPVPARGRDTILSVPLALRQREITRELDDLNRGVLVGAVVVVLLVACLGVYVAGRVFTPVARLTRATRQIAAGRLDVRIAADTADELRRLVDDFNAMAATLSAQRDELARTNQIKAWAEMARQVAHEIKNPLTPIQLAAEHLQRVHADRKQPLGPVFDQCLDVILGQVRLLRQIASEFSNFAASPTPHLAPIELDAFLRELVGPYRVARDSRTRIDLDVEPGLPPISADRTLLSRAITNVVENALQAMPSGGALAIRVTAEGSDWVAITLADEGVGMDATARQRAFEPYFSTKTAGSGLGLPNAKRNVELCGGTMTLESTAGRGTTITVRLRRAEADPRGALPRG